MEANDRDGVPQRQADLTWAYTEFVSDVSAILYRYDPLGIGHPMPGNEYNGEAQRVVPKLAKCATRDEVEAVTAGLFPEGDPVPSAKGLVDELWWALDLFRSRSAS